MKRTLFFLTILLVIVVFAMPVYADPKPKDVKVVNKPVVKAQQRGDWNVTVNNDETNPVPVTVQPDGLSVNVSTVYRFAGYSSQTVTGSAGGIPGMNNICKSEFGGKARMCYTQEYYSSNNTDIVSTSGLGWINPSIITSYLDSNDELWYIDYGGKLMNAQLGGYLDVPNCFLMPFCHESLNVTCCKPVGQEP